MSAVDVDLFAGPGGWDTGIADLGIRPVGVEIEADPCRTARAAGHERQHVDVAELDPLDVVSGWADDVGGLIASPPCQGFSLAGKGRGRDDSVALLDEIGYVATPDDLDRMMTGLRRNMSDARTVLVLEPLRWAMLTRPRWLAWEQVPTVLPIWQACAELLAIMGYSVRTAILTTEMFGVPQTRRRAVLVARRADVAREHGPASLPVPTHSRYRSTDPTRLDPGVLPWVSMADALADRPAGYIGFPRRADDRDVVTLGGVDYRARDLRHTSAPAQTVTEKARSWDFNDQSGTDFDPLWPEKRPATAVAGRGLVGNPGATANRFNGSTKSRNDGVRITVDEAAALQSFPAGYPWAGSSSSQFQQIGDAVPPLLARAIVSAVAA